MNNNVMLLPERVLQNYDGHEMTESNDSRYGTPHTKIVIYYKGLVFRHKHVVRIDKYLRNRCWYANDNLIEALLSNLEPFAKAHYDRNMEMIQNK